MPNKDQHLSDQEILLVGDGELQPRRAAEVREHLSACWACRARMAEIEGTIGEFVKLHRHDFDPQLPSAVGSRALLKAQLTELANQSRPNLWTQFLLFVAGGRSLAYVSAGLLLVAFGGGLMHQHILRGKTEQTVAAFAAPVPEPNLTPGAIRQVSTEDICKLQGDEEARTIPFSLQRKVFQEYGMANARATDYEVDYLITPELGGADDIRNLWPEPHSSTLWNSYVKDDLENELHQMVCKGEVDLPTAQHDIATDWISAYKKYFHTDRPIQDHANGNSDSRLKPRT